LIRKCIPIPQKIYSITKRLRTLDKVEKYYPGFLSFIDATEQPISRPSDNKRKKMFYSGRKKRHTVKMQLMINNQCIFIHKLGHKKGSRYDYDIYKADHPIMPKEVVNVYDLGYLGIEKASLRSCLDYSCQIVGITIPIISRKDLTPSAMASTIVSNNAETVIH